jgi:hypothetical protein
MMGIKTYTFEEFVEYGKVNGGNIVNDMPWSFEFHRCAVTHENDDLYLISRSGVNETLQFKRGDIIACSSNGYNVLVYTDNMRAVKLI